MTKTPALRAIDRSLRTLKSDIRAAVKQVNQQAARLLAKGNYSGAQRLVEVARSVGAFIADVDLLLERWRAARGSSATGASGKAPLWSYYPIILSSLAELGGETTTTELVSRMELTASKVFNGSELGVLSNGRPRWQAMIKRARRHMIKEGFIAAAKGATWRITSAGRKAAVSESSRPQS